jgi:hypothetical protein
MPLLIREAKKWKHRRMAKMRQPAHRPARIQSEKFWHRGTVHATILLIKPALRVKGDSGSSERRDRFRAGFHSKTRLKAHIKKTKTLPPPYCHFLDAAVGWLELSNPGEALEELKHISADFLNDPQVLEIKWQIFARTDDWDKSLPVAEAFCAVAPGLPQGWLHQAVSLYRLNRTQDAWNLLLPLAKKFPRSWIIPYDLACYACQLGQVEEGRQWLRKAFRLGDPSEVKSISLADPDLKVLWTEIESSQFESASEETESQR